MTPVAVCCSKADSLSVIVLIVGPIKATEAVTTPVNVALEPVPEQSKQAMAGAEHPEIKDRVMTNFLIIRSLQIVERIHVHRE